MGPSSKPRSKLICEKWSSVCVLQSWFYHILHRTLRFGAILSYRFDQFLNSKKLIFLMRILKKGDFVSVSMKAESMIKVLWSNMYISEGPTKLDGDRPKHVDHLSLTPWMISGQSFAWLCNIKDIAEISLKYYSDMTSGMICIV